MLRLLSSSTRPADLGQRPGAAQVIPVAGQRRTAGGTRLLLHDQRTLDPGLQTVQLRLLDPLGQASSTRRASRPASPGRDRRPCRRSRTPPRDRAACGRGIDAVAQAAALADLGEQPGAHAAAQHAHRAEGLKIIGMAIGHAGVGDADLRLLGIVRQVPVMGRAGVSSGRPSSPGDQSPSNSPTRSFSRGEVDAAGHAENRAVGPIAAVEVAADVVDRGRLDRFLLALRRAAPRLADSAAGEARSSPSAPARLPPLEAPGAWPAARPQIGRWAGVGGGARRRRSPGPWADCRPRGPAVAGVRAGDRLAPLDAQVVEIEDELPAVARAGAAQGHLAGETAEALAIRRIVGAAGRQQERKGRRLQRVDPLGHEHQTVRVSVGEDRFRHGEYAASRVL